MFTWSSASDHTGRVGRVKEPSNVLCRHLPAFHFFRFLHCAFPRPALPGWALVMGYIWLASCAKTSRDVSCDGSECAVSFSGASCFCTDARCQSLFSTERMHVRTGRRTGLVRGQGSTPVFLTVLKTVATPWLDVSSTRRLLRAAELKSINTKVLPTVGLERCDLIPVPTYKMWPQRSH